MPGDQERRIWVRAGPPPPRHDSVVVWVDEDGHLRAINEHGVDTSPGIGGTEGIEGPQGPPGPQGPTGPTGVQGPQGPQGLTGPQGVDGVQGPRGVAGAQGVPGDPGPIGPQGPLGPVGPAGPLGPQGNDGAVGATGATGPPGATGAQGPQGDIGSQGPTGAAGGGSVQSDWNWLAAATTVHVAAGRIGVDQDAPSTSTQVRLHRLDQHNVDYGTVIGALKAGDHVYLQQANLATSYHRYRVTGTPTLAPSDSDNWIIPVTTESGSPVGSEPANGAGVLVAFQYTPAAGPQGIQGVQGPAGPGVPVGGTSGQVLSKKTSADYDTQWSAAAATDLRYNGDYSAGSYSDGDIVVYNGVTYLCVKPTSAAPTPWPGAPGPSAYAEAFADVVSTLVAEAAAVAVVTTPAVLFDGVTPYLIEFSCAAILGGGQAGDALAVNVWIGATDFGRIVTMVPGGGALGGSAAETGMLGGVFRRRITPPAGSAAVSARLWSSGHTGGLHAGNGTPGNGPPMSLRVVPA